MRANNSAASHLFVSHLSEDDLDEILLGIAPPESSAHLTACHLCTERFATFQTELRAQMASFNQASLAWSEARSNTISRDLTKHKSTPRLTLPAVWSATAAMVLAATLALHVSLDRRSASLEASNSTASQTISGSTDAIHPEHDQHELAADNAMLAAIDSEMGTPQPAQFGLYQNAKAPVETQNPIAPEQMRD
jgi:hypothetical protein